MTTVGITGAAGFLGWHVRCRMHAVGLKTVCATRETFAQPELLADFCRSADVIIHIAGVNRADSDDEVAAGNRLLADRLVEALEAASSSAPVLYTNSTQSEQSNIYGKAKRAAGVALATYCEKAGVAFLDLVLPHLFGEFGRPNYNSVVSTFAHALATGVDPTVNRYGQLELLHAQAVANRVIEFVNSPTGGTQRAQGAEIGVGDVWDRLRFFHARYVGESTVPSLDEVIDLQLFNVLRSHLYAAGYYPCPITLHSDDRGGFAEICRADGTGQTSLSTTMPGVSRGDHYHFDKIERFVVVQGTASIKLRRLLTNETQTYAVTGDSPVMIDMPPLVTHNITNTGEDSLVTVFWAGDHFDPNVPDTFAEPVEVAA